MAKDEPNCFLFICVTVYETYFTFLSYTNSKAVCHIVLVVDKSNATER